VTPLVLVLVAFGAMEAVSYAAHRWVMHGVGLGWHRSHHQPPRARFERNDLFPLCFSTVGVLLFALATVGPAVRPLFWVGTGVTLYGALYLFVHEVYIHRRLDLRLPRLAYLDWLRDSHRIHHLFGGEPYGMLLPLVPRSLRDRAAARLAAGGADDRGSDDRVPGDSVPGDRVIDRRIAPSARTRL
jgi:beta-carotene 3-hydroxylase